MKPDAISLAGSCQSDLDRSHVSENILETCNPVLVNEFVHLFAALCRPR